MSKPMHYFSVFDSLRGVAALVVSVYHVEWLYSGYHWPLIRYADFMVDFFFVLSGFCISHIYGRRMRDMNDARQYLYLRFWRVYPLHLVFLLVLLGIEIIKYVAVTRYGLTANNEPFPEGSGGILLGNFLLIHSLGFFDRWLFNVPSWSISTEAFAYIVFAGVFLWQQRKTGRVVASLLFLIGCLWILQVFNHGSLIGNSPRFGFVRCLAGFFAGVLVQHAFVFLKEAHRKPPTPWLMDVASVTLLIMSGLLAGVLAGKGAWEFLALPVFSLLILTVALHEHGLIGRVFDRKPLVWLGRVSYSIYMSHLAVIFVFSQFLRFVLEIPLFDNAKGTETYDTPIWLGNLLLLAYLAVVLVVSHYSWVYVEDRYRKLSKARLAARSATAR